jgi:NlpC/P60 family
LTRPGTRRRARRPALAAAALWLALVIALATAATAAAKTYTDVPAKYWDHKAIDWVTDQGAPGMHLLDDYAGTGLFKPGKAITREQLARVVVRASGRETDVVNPVIPIADLATDDPFFHDVEVAVSLKLMGLFKDGFRPDAAAPAWQTDGAIVRMLKLENPTDDWGVLPGLNPRTWRPNSGWKTGAPRYFATEVATRYLGLRKDHSDDALEVSPGQGMPRSEVAYALYQAMHVSAWRIDGLATFDSVALPALSDRQKNVLAFAFKYVGFPYIWGGEYPAKDSPYGTQAHAGFDCSGFVWWVLKIHFGYTLNERTAAGMAAGAKTRITRAHLKPGDILFFGPSGKSSSAASIYHAALYIGNGWFIHSTGSQDGVSLSSLNWAGWSWQTDFAWGRRVLTKAQLALGEAPLGAAVEATPAPQPSPEPSAPVTPAPPDPAAPGTP